MDFNQHRVGRNIRILRKRMRMNINQLASAVSITPSFLGLVERGERGLRIENLCKICSVFGVSLDDLVYNDYSDSKGYIAKEAAESDFIKQMEAVMRGATNAEYAFVLKLAREFRDSYNMRYNENAGESDEEMGY